MAFIAGIDEAGFGPLLGPLVVAATAFEVSDELADVSLWRLLAGSVSRRPGRRSGKIAIGDSKKLFSRQRANPLEHLERGVLAALAVCERRPDSLRKLLGCLAPAAGKEVANYPWYDRCDVGLPHCISASDVYLAANSLRAAMAEVGIRLLAMRAEAVFVGEFNRLVQATANKSTTLFDVTGRLLAHLWERIPGGSMRIYVDRHGGRVRYLPALQRLFADCRFKIIEESETFSAYRVSDGDRRVEIFFSVGGEDRQLPVALASMVSKYIRELFMLLLNGFWSRHVADLAPTAGYYADGRRFSRDISPALRRLGMDERILFRCR
ncbi:MAG: hypothetical protein KAU28_01835 [Phycisphaerae bacterium]|nr:hypothetical protein [Phycisphaerae bacterium]